MDVLDLYAKISLDKKEYDDGLTEASEKSQSVGSKISGALKTAGKIGGVAIAAVGTAVTATSTALINGVSNVAAYGDNIDKMSQKMGLTAEAYQEWDAVMQHSGTSMESMKASMKTLANAAETGNKAFEKIGLTQKDLANMSQQDLFEATIAGLQNVEDTTQRTYLAGQLLGRGATELGALLNTSAEDTQAMRDRIHELGGVMSDEAVKSAAAFQDQLQDLTTGFDGLKRGLTSELLPSITEVMAGLTDIFAGDYDEGLEKISSGIENTVAKISDMLPKIIEIGGSIIEQLAIAIVENIPKILPSLVDLVMSIGDMIVENLPLLIETGMQVILQLALGIAQALPELIPAIVDTVLTIAEYLIDNVDLLIDAAIALIIGLADGLIAALPKLIEKAPEIVIKLVEAIIRNAPKILEAATSLIFKLIEGIVNLFGKIVEVGGQLVDKVKNGFSQKVQDAKNWGRDIIQNFIDGIKEKWEHLKQTVSNVAQTVKDFLGFSEPEKGPLSNFHTYAPDMMDLFAKGIRDNENVVTDQIAKSFDFGNITGNVNVTGTASGIAENSGFDTVLQRIEALLAQYLPQVQKDIVLDTGALVGGTVAAYDAAFGTRSNRGGLR
jgi:phage-related protein